MKVTWSFLCIAVLYVLIVVVVLYRTFKDKIKKPFWKRLIFAVSMFAAIAAVGVAGYAYFGLGSYAQQFITLATAMACFCIPYTVLDYNLGQCLFISGIVKCYADDVALIATVFYYLISDHIPEYYMEFPAWPVVLISAISFPFIRLFFSRLIRPALDCSGFLSSWLFAWLLPFFANVMYALYMQPVFTDITDFPGREFIFVPFLWVVLTFSAYIILLASLIGQSKAAKLKEELHISDLQINAQQKQLGHFQSYIEGTAKARHDMRHHMVALQGLAEKKDYKGMEEYLSACISRIDKKSSGIYSGNPAVDALIGYYRQLAEEEKIRVSIQIEAEDAFVIADNDICIILGNLLENAYEACKRQTEGNPYFTVKIHQTGRVLVILVENSYSGTVRKKDGVFLSAKAKNRNGIGLESVIDVTRKYNGIPKIEYDGKIFRVSLLLNGNRK